MDAQAIRNEILKLSDENYRKFSSSLIPGTDNIVGVRLPLLRKLAKEIAKNNWQEYLNFNDTIYYEEIMLQGLVIAYIKVDIDEHLKYVSRFIPKINNWGVCDSFSSGLKFTKKNMDKVWDFLQPYFKSQAEFDLRFALVMTIDYFIEQDYIEKILMLINSIKHEGYYVKMAAAWVVSICYIRFPEHTLEFLKNCNLDVFTYNKALQKITESNRVTPETKKMIRSMKLPY